MSDKFFRLYIAIIATCFLCVYTYDKISSSSFTANAGYGDPGVSEFSPFYIKQV